MLRGFRELVRERAARIEKRTLYALALGQLLSLLITGTGVTSSLLAGYGVNMPSTQSLINYALLSLYMIPLALRERWAGVKETLKQKWWMYAFLAACDVEANFLVVLAYQYTSLSSIMLLDCFSIPCVMALGHVFLGHRFRWPQFVGVALCVAGVGALVLSDWLHGAWVGTHNGSNQALGDGLVLGAAVLYAVSNTGQERLVVSASKLEYLAFLGVFGLPISAVQSVVLDHVAWTNGVSWTPRSIGLMLGFAVCLFSMYSLVPIMLQLAGATFLNLSLLTSDVLAIIFGVFLFHYVPSLFYLLASLLIVAGLVFWNVSPSKPREESLPVMVDDEEQLG